MSTKEVISLLDISTSEGLMNANLVFANFILRFMPLENPKFSLQISICKFEYFFSNSYLSSKLDEFSIKIILYFLSIVFKIRLIW